MAMGGIPGVPNSAFPSRLVREDSGSGQLLSGFHPGGTASQPSSGDPLMPLSLPGGHGSAGGLGTHGSGVALHTATGPANTSHLQNGLSTDDVQSLMAQVTSPCSSRDRISRVAVLEASATRIAYVPVTMAGLAGGRSLT